MYRDPAAPVGSSAAPITFDQASRDAGRIALDLFGQPSPPRRVKKKALPSRSMSRVQPWEQSGGWEESILDRGRAVAGPAAGGYDDWVTDALGTGNDRPGPDDTCSTALIPELNAPLPLDREARVAWMAERHRSRTAIFRPADPTIPPDLPAAVVAILREMAHQQIAESSGVRPPVIEVDSKAKRPRYRLRWWKSTSRPPKFGYWTNLGSFSSRDAAEAAKITWLKEHSPTALTFHLPTYLEDLHQLAVWVGLAEGREPENTLSSPPEDDRSYAQRVVDEAVERSQKRYGGRAMAP